jgi:Spy/CpxP family protein refolding chaperone
MKYNKITLIAALAVAGMVCMGSTATAQDTKPDKKPELGQRPPAGRPGTRIAQELKLTEEQNKKFQAAMAEQREKGTKLREDTSLTPEQKREKSQALRTESQKKIKEILTPEQYQQWEKLRSQPRQARPGGPGAPGGPDAKPKKKAE